MKKLLELHSHETESTGSSFFHTSSWNLSHPSPAASVFCALAMHPAFAHSTQLSWYSIQSLQSLSLSLLFSSFSFSCHPPSLHPYWPPALHFSLPSQWSLLQPVTSNPHVRSQLDQRCIPPPHPAGFMHTNTYFYIYIYIYMSNLQTQVQAHAKVSGTSSKTCSHQDLSSSSFFSSCPSSPRAPMSCQDAWNKHVSTAKNLDIEVNIDLNLPPSTTQVQVSGTPSKTCSHQDLSSSSFCSSFSSSPRAPMSCQDAWNKHVSTAKYLDMEVNIALNLPPQVQSQVQTHVQVPCTPSKTCSHQNLSSGFLPAVTSSCQDGC